MGDKNPVRCQTVQWLIDLKRRWIATPKSAENARERHEAIRSANELRRKPRVLHNAEAKISRRGPSP